MSDRSLNQGSLFVQKITAVLLLSAFLVLGGTAMAQAVYPQQGQAAPLNPEFLKYRDALHRGVLRNQSPSGHPLGAIPAPLDLSHLRGQRTPEAFASLPAAYDLRNYSRMAAVRNQGGCGACWSFASFGSLESTLLPAETRDFSEMNLKNTSGFDADCCSGGNCFMSTAYLARWGGPWNESDDPYADSCTSATGKTVQKHLQSTIFIPDRASFTSNDAIKQALMTYGGVYALFHWEDYNFSDTYNGYYDGTDTDTNHAITIAGWDDDFDASFFSTAPPGNGAFLVKNSWGTYWGDNGYFYISYYDTSLKQFAVFLGEPVGSSNVIYQYDTLGWVNSYGYGSTTAWFANIFTASASQLTGVGFYAASNSSSYQMYIYKDATSGPRTGTQALSQTGTLGTAGYHSIALTTPISLTAGQKFSVVVQLTTPGYNWPIPFQYAVADYSSQAKGQAGTGYFSKDGSSWKDATSAMDSTTSVCLKAFGTSGGGTKPYSYWVPVASHASGSGGSQWRTDLGILNRSGATANLDIYLHLSTGNLHGTATLAGAHQGIYADIVGQLNYTGAGAMEVQSDQILSVTSKTYNQTSNGTYGQFLDGFTPSDGLSAGQTIYLPQLTENPGFRTNVAVSNISASAASATVYLYSGSGTALASYAVSLNPGDWKQENQPFMNKAGQTNMNAGYAKVVVNSGSGVVAYASVVDNTTGDGTTIPMKR